MGIFSPKADSKPTDKVLITVLNPASESLEVKNKFMITYHPWYHDFDTEMVDKSLKITKDLGVSFLRFDIRWKDLFPEENKLDMATINWYQGFIQKMKNEYSLNPFIVLSNSPDYLKGKSFEEIRILWDRYIEAISSYFGKDCIYFQTLNEYNGFVHNSFSFTQSCTLIESASKILKRDNKDIKIIANIGVGWPGWKNNIASLITRIYESLDVVGFDYYPGTYNLIHKDEWRNFREIFELTQIKYGINKPLSMAIIETGIPASESFLYKLGGKTKQNQKNYYENLFETYFTPSLRNDDFELIGFYELCDADTSSKYNYECHFGLVSTDLKNFNPAYYTLQSFIQSKNS